jgi:hypothetical protein
MSTIHTSTAPIQTSLDKDSSPPTTLDESPSTNTPTQTTAEGKNSHPIDSIEYIDDTPAVGLVPYSIPQTPIFPTDDTTRPHRNRQPSKKKSHS